MNRGTSRYGTPRILDSPGSPPGTPVSIGRKAGECAMATMISRLRDYLDERNIHYQTIHHRRDYTAQETAADTATPGSQFAKAVLFKVEDGFVMAVLPAHYKVSIDKLRAYIGCEKIRLATEDEILEVCPDCAVGAEPPFGNLYGIPVYLCKDMSSQGWITFNAGTHEDVVRMKHDDYVELVRPQIGDFSIRP